MRMYLDHNATTPVAPEVADAMATTLRTTFGNPSSVHRHGQEAKTALDEARAAVARLIGAEPTAVIFTSGDPRPTTWRFGGPPWPWPTPGDAIWWRVRSSTRRCCRL